MKTLTEQVKNSQKVIETLKGKTLDEMKVLQKEGNDKLKEINSMKLKYSKLSKLSNKDKLAYSTLLLTEQDILKGLGYISSVLVNV